MKNRILLIPLLYLLVFSLNAQVKNTKISVQVGKSETPIPFAIVSDKDHKPLGLFNIEGKYTLKTTLDSVIISSPFFKDTTLSISGKKEILLSITNIVFKSDFKSDSVSSQIIDSVYQNRKNFSTECFAPYYYKGYNKTLLSSDSVELSKNIFRKLSDSFTKKIKAYKKQHHIAVLETASNRRFQDKTNEDERITGVKISGVTHPTVGIINSQFQSSDLYNRYLRLFTVDYVNPINRKSYRFYSFRIYDIIPTDNDTLYAIIFQPKRHIRREMVKGMLLISAQHKYIVHALFSPAELIKVNELAAQSNTTFVNDSLPPFPSQNSSAILFPKIGIGNEKTRYSIYSLQNFTHFEPDTSFNKKTFTDVSLAFEKDLHEIDSTNWETTRPAPLTQKEENTYAFFDTIGTFKQFQHYVLLAEKLVSRKIYLKYADINLDRLLIINDYEKLRPGLDINTDKNLSKIFSLGAYAGYGFNDKKVKYDARLIIWPENKWNATGYIKYFSDLSESGGLAFPFNERQYSTENIRNWGIYLMEEHRGTEIKASMAPIKFFRFETSYKNTISTPTYEYSYKGEEYTGDRFSELEVGVRYAFGQKNIQLDEELIPQRTKFPEFWFLYRQSLQSFNYGFQYSQFATRVDYRYRHLTLGETVVQFTAGTYLGKMPLWRLYNGKGSKGFLTVTYNSFETMNYNEFFSNRFFNAFLTHDIGSLHFGTLIKPRIVLAFNYGIGSLNNKEDYSDYKFKTMEKGYYEAGIMVNDIFVLKMAIIKLSLGLGYYQRLGYYKLDRKDENSVFKFVLKFKL